MRNNLPDPEKGWPLIKDERGGASDDSHAEEMPDGQWSRFPTQPILLKAWIWEPSSVL